MKNYFAPADIVRYTAPYAVNPGDGMLVGGLFGVACTTAASGEKTDVSTEGMYYLTSVSAETAAEGAAAYWDAGNRRVSVTTGTGIGHFPYGKGAGETSTRVRLQASPGSVSGARNASRSGSNLKRGNPLMRLPSTSTGFTAESANITITKTVRNSRACLELTFAALTGPHSMNFTIPTKAYSANVHMTYEVENAAEWNGGNVRLGMFTDGTFANGVQYQQSIGAGNGYNGVRCVAPMNSAPAEWAVVGAGTLASTMTVCRLRFTRSASPTGTTRIWLYEIAEDEAQTLPAIYIGADDGHMTWYTDGIPVLEKYGFSSYGAYIADDQNGTTRMRDAAEWSDFVARGHYAIVHGCKSGVSSLRDYFTTFAPYASPRDAMVADIRWNIDRMAAAGLDASGRGRKVYALPQGNHQPTGGAGDDTVANAMRDCGLTVGRRASVENGLLINGGTRGMQFYLPIIGHVWNTGGNEATNITNIVARMQAEVAAGRSCILMFHEVRAVPATAEQITPANLETIVAAAAVLVRAGSARPGDLRDLADELGTYTSPAHVGA